MDFKIGSSVTLSDGIKYMVVSKANCKNKDYYYLMNMQDSKDAKFCYYEDGKMYFVEKEELDIEILKGLYNCIKEELNKNE